MRRVISKVLCAALPALFPTRSLHAQSVSSAEDVPIVSLRSAARTSTQTFGAIIGIRELRDGRVMVDDGGSHQLWLFDSTLVSGTVVLDSASDGKNKYGRGRAPIIPYLGDSTLFPDNEAFAMLVIDDQGNVVRSMALPTQSDLGGIRQGAGLDHQGRLVYLGESPIFRAKVQGESDTKSDSFPLLRADFDLRRTDTIGQVMRPMRLTKATSSDGSATVGMWMVDPLQPLDDWTILSDGTVALVRGHDYHVDWIRENDVRSASGKLPFDWKRLSDADKQRVVDSIRVVIGNAMNDGSIANRVEMLTVTRNPGVRPARPPAETRPTTGRASTAFPGFNLLPDDPNMIKKVNDYYPPLRTGAAMADADGNLWILPTTSKNSLHGELVYDVVNNEGDLFRRVRVPLGRLIVGFGKNGVVYLSSGSIANGFVLERSRVVATQNADTSARLNGSISGTVSTSNGLSLPGVTVSLVNEDRRAMSDSSGRFSLHDIQAGGHTVLFRRIGYNSVERRVALQSGANVQIAITLSATPQQLNRVVVESSGGSRRRGTSSIGGIVIDSSGRGVPGADVRLLGSGLSTTTDSGGTFAFATLVAGSYIVRARHEGLAAGSAVMQIIDDDDRSIQVRLWGLPQKTKPRDVRTASGYGVTDLGLDAFDRRVRSRNSITLLGTATLFQANGAALDMVLRSYRDVPGVRRKSATVAEGVGSTIDGDCLLIDGRRALYQPLSTYSSISVLLIEVFRANSNVDDFTVSEMQSISECRGSRDHHPGYYVLWTRAMR